MRAKTKRTVVVIISLLVCIAMQGQQKTKGTIDLQSYESSLEVRDFNPAMLTNDKLTWTKTRSGADQGFRWIDRISNMPEYLMSYYNEYGDKVKEVLGGSVNWMSDPSLAVYDMQDNRYLVEIRTFEGSESFDYSADATQDVIEGYAKEIASNACSKSWKEVDCFVSYLVLCLSRDFPEAFWLKSYYKWGASNKLGFEYGGGTCIVKYTQVAYFIVQAEDYDCRMEGLQSPELISTASVSFNSKVAEILGNCLDGTAYEKVVYLNDWLTMHNCYNTQYGSMDVNDLPGVVFSPLSALGSLTGAEGPVCEGYARAFKVLCDQVGIPCVLMCGEAKASSTSKGEDHMWTEVNMDDGNWYAVDVTWNDPVTPGIELVSGAENHKWLLLGSNDIVAKDWTFTDSHPVSFLTSIKEEYVSQWKLSAFSLITENKYDPSTDISAVTGNTDAGLHVYSLDGRFLGVFKSANELRESLNSRQVLIVDGKKTLSK